MYGGTAAAKLRPCADPAGPQPPSQVPETVMPTLHLPAAHTDTDVALAIEVADVVGSHELYVSWTHGEGPGLPPEVKTLVADRRAETAVVVSPFSEVLVAMVQGIAALWQAILRPPSTRPALSGGPEGERRDATRPATEEKA